MTNPLTPLPPVYRVGGTDADDWARDMGFFYQRLMPDGVTPMDITGYTPGAELYVPFSPTPIDLTVGAGNVAIIAATSGTFAIMVPRSITSTLTPSPTGCSLQVFLIGTDGFRNTVAIQPIIVVPGRLGATS